VPTYEYRCKTCEKHHEEIQTIGEYSRSPRIPQCCGAATERFLSVVAVTAGANALHGDRHYDGLRAPDGADISSRTKHREYLKRTGLAVADDFKGTWKKQKQEREAIRTGNFQDKELRQTIEKEVFRKLP
jgi:putative FmdB family regulatory protein